MIAQLDAEALPVHTACRLLSVSSSGFYDWKNRPLSPRAIRNEWLTDVIRDVHTASRGRYGYRRVHAELRLGRQLIVSRRHVAELMRHAGLAGPPLRRRFRRHLDLLPSQDLVERAFARSEPNRLWVTDITEHRTREGKLYCCVVLDTFSRRVVGWSIDSTPAATLATNALTMAIENRRPEAGFIIYAPFRRPVLRPLLEPSQFSSWSFTQRARAAGLLPSMGTIGDCYDNAVAEAFWGRMQTELLNRQRWSTRVELANAMFDYLEIFHNRQRRHSSIGMLTPIEFERLHTTTA